MLPAFSRFPALALAIVLAVVFVCLAVPDARATDCAACAAVPSGAVQPIIQPVQAVQQYGYAVQQVQPVQVQAVQQYGYQQVQQVQPVQVQQAYGAGVQLVQSCGIGLGIGIGRRRLGIGLGLGLGVVQPAAVVVQQPVLGLGLGLGGRRFIGRGPRLGVRAGVGFRRGAGIRRAAPAIRRGAVRRGR